MANCLRTIKCSLPSYSNLHLQRRISFLTKSLSELQIENLTNKGVPYATCHNRGHTTAVRFVDDANSCQSHNLYCPLDPDVAQQLLAKTVNSKFTRRASQPELYSYKNLTKNRSKTPCNCKDSIRVFKLPPDSLWYPPGATHCGSNIYYSISYSPVEQEIIDETFGNLSADLTCKEYQDINVGNVFPSNLERTPVPPSYKIYDIAPLLQNKILREEAFHFCSSSLEGDSNKVDKPTGLPTENQLNFIKTTLENTLPSLFFKPMNYTIYELDLIFENRIRGTITYGLSSYIKQSLLLRTIGHLKFSSVKFEILGLTVHPEEGTVCMRWRIIGISGLQMIVKFWKMNISNWKEEVNSDSWYDGFSTFHVNSKGLVYKHVADCVTPDKNIEKAKSKALPAALAGLLGLKPSLDAAANIGFDSTALAALQVEEDFFSQLMMPLEKMT